MVLKNRYKYCPQMKEYDKLRKVWLPYLMYFNQPNYSSSIINTDSRGFRCVTNKSNQMISQEYYCTPFYYSNHQPITQMYLAASSCLQIENM